GVIMIPIVYSDSTDGRFQLLLPERPHLFPCQSRQRGLPCPATLWRRTRGDDKARRKRADKPSLVEELLCGWPVAEGESDTEGRGGSSAGGPGCRPRVDCGLECRGGGAQHPRARALCRGRAAQLQPNHLHPIQRELRRLLRLYPVGEFGCESSAG